MEEQDSRQYLASKVHPIFEKILIELLITKPDDPVEFMSQWLMTTGQQFRPQEKQNIPFSHTFPVQQQQGSTPRRSVAQSLQNPAFNRQPSNKPGSNRYVQIPNSNQPQSSQRDSLKLSQQMNSNLQQALEQSDMQQKHSLEDEIDNQFEPPHLGPHDQPSPSPIVPQQKESTIPILQKQQSLLPNTNSYNNKVLKKSQTQNNQQFLVPLVQKPPHPQNSSIPTPRDQSVQQIKSIANSKQASSRQLLQQKQEDPEEHPLQQLNSLSSQEQQKSQVHLPPQQQEQLLTSQQKLQQQQQQQQLSQIQLPKYRVINKNKEQKQRIMKKLVQCSMFKDLGDQKCEIIAMAMEEKKYKSNDIVIKQGDDGDLLYLVDQGLLDCSKRPKPNHGEDKFIKSYQPGEMFGEMALLYNEKRQATITAKTECVLWALDKETFDSIVKESALLKRQTNDSILEKFEIFKTIDPYLRQLIAEALMVSNFKADTYVFEQGNKGDYFYLVQEGELKALKSENFDNQEDKKEVYTFKEFDYFGELAMLKEQGRQASIYCMTDCTLMYLNRQQFKKLLAPLHELLIKNSERYVNFSYY